jgi:tetratricopeptide (TPR) repeat protein
VDEIFPEMWSGAAQVVTLSPLSKKASERLALQVLGGGARPETVARIVAESEGNALFLEELIRAAAEGDGGGSSGTVLAMMQARIGRLPAGARRTLRAASVFGEAPGQGGIRALLGGAMSEQEIDGCLARLGEEELLEERSEGRLPGAMAYRFRHALVRDAAYSLSSEEERVASHRLAAEYLEARGEPDSLVLAEHFVQGREPRRAAPYYLRAGEEEYQANDLPAALSSAARGLASFATGELRGALLSLTVTVSLWRDEFAEVIALGTEAIDLLPSGPKHWCRSCRSVCVAATLGDRPAVIAQLTPRFAQAEPGADARFEYVQGATWFAIMLAIAGRKEESRVFRGRARQIGAAVNRDDLLTWGYLLAMEAVDHFLLEMLPWSSVAEFSEGADALEILGEQSYQMVLRANRGKGLYDLGDIAGAEAELRRTIARSERLGEALSLTYARTYLARLLAWTAPPDRFDEAERLAREVIAAKNASLMGTAYGALAEIRRRQGDLAGAEREARAGTEVARPFPSYAADITAHHASILLEQGRAEEALAITEAAVREQERLGLDGHGEIDARLSLAEALHALARVEDARAALRDLLPRLRKRLDDIPEPAARRRYLANVPANARVVALTTAWLGEDTAGLLGARTA